MARKAYNHMADSLKVIGGGILGAGLALLLAPQSGRKTRKDIVRYAKTVGGRTDKTVHQFSEKMDEYVDAVGHDVSELLHNGKEMTQEAKRDLLSVIDKGQQRLEKQKSKIAQMIS